MPESSKAAGNFAASGAAGAVFAMDNEVALVTGASSGLGRRFAQVLAANGARVGLAGRRRDELDALAQELRSAGAEALVLPFEITDRTAIAPAFDALQSTFGPVTVLVNNAGIAGDGTTLDISYEHWRHVMDVDLDSVFTIAQEAAARMRSAGTGNIINVSSILGVRPAKGLSAYAVAKAGVVQLTRVMALELAPSGIRVNSLAPGYVVTGMNREFFASRQTEVITRAIPMNRVGQVEDFDGAILLLASNASRFMTGATLVVDGGHTLVI